MIGVAIICFYALDAALHGRIVKALKWRGVKMDSRAKAKTALL
jgi:hypothetical protein